jgi:hypothetical protein
MESSLRSRTIVTSELICKQVYPLFQLKDATTQQLSAQ